MTQTEIKVKKMQGEIEKLTTQKASLIDKKNKIIAQIAEVDKAIADIETKIDNEKMKAIKMTAKKNGVSVDDVLALLSDHLPEVLELVGSDSKADDTKQTSDQTSDEETAAETDEDEKEETTSGYSY